MKYLATFSSFNGMKSCLGLSWDVYDGERQRMKPTSLSPDQVLTKDRANGKKVPFQKKAALASSPNILELLSHSFFVGGYFVGPQFTMKKYQQVGHKSSKQLIELMHLLS